MFPILGFRKLEQLQENIKALETVHLTPEEVKELEDVSPLDLGFPHNFIGNSVQTSRILGAAGKYSFVEEPRPISKI